MQNAVIIVALLIIGLCPIIYIIYSSSAGLDKQGKIIKRKFKLDEIQDLGRVQYNHAIVGVVDVRLYEGRSALTKKIYITDTKSELRVAGQYRHKYEQVSSEQALELLKSKRLT